MIDLLATTLGLLITFLGVVLIHELGHFFAARLVGVKAEVFSVGFGRTLWSRISPTGVRWQIAAIPMFARFSSQSVRWDIARDDEFSNGRPLACSEVFSQNLSLEKSTQHMPRVILPTKEECENPYYLLWLIELEPNGSTINGDVSDIRTIVYPHRAAKRIGREGIDAFLNTTDPRRCMFEGDVSRLSQINICRVEIVEY